MKKILPILFFVFFLVLLKPPVVLSYSQSDFDNAFKDYLASASKYHANFQQFQVEKGKYLSFKSIMAEENSFKAARVMLLSKLNFIVNYLKAVRIKFALETKVLDYQENLLFIQLDNDITSYANTIELINNAQSLADLDKIDPDFKNKYQNSQKLAYKALGLIEFNKTSTFLKSLKNQLQALKLKTEEIEKNNSSSYDFTSFKKRIEQIEKNLQEVEVNYNSEKKNFFVKIEAGGSEMETDFSDFVNASSKIFSGTNIFFPNLEEIIYYLLKI